MKRIVSSLFLLLLIAYVVSYFGFRSTHMAVWEQKEANTTYVMFPKENPALYYFYRPITYVDNQLTGMTFNIGPHEHQPSQPVIREGLEGE